MHMGKGLEFGFTASVCMGVFNITAKRVKRSKSHQRVKASM